MGDRRNVQVKDSASEDGVFFYTHWTGSDLPHTVANALRRGEGRWGDTPYLSRIIFCEMVKGEVLDETGYGISTHECDPENPTIVVNDWDRTVSLREDVWSYNEFIERFAT
jgi:hypothetical protein